MYDKLRTARGFLVLAAVLMMISLFLPYEAFTGARAELVELTREYMRENGIPTLGTGSSTLSLFSFFILGVMHEAVNTDLYVEFAREIGVTGGFLILDLIAALCTKPGLSIFFTICAAAPNALLAFFLYEGGAAVFDTESRFGIGMYLFFAAALLSFIAGIAGAAQKKKIRKKERIERAAAEYTG